MRRSRLLAFSITAALTFLTSGSIPAMAGQILAVHQGATDPTTEGFAILPRVGSSSLGPLANDLGLPAWQITGSSQSSEFSYGAPGLTTSQQAEIASQGFTMTMVARVLQNGIAPAYDSTNFVTIGGASVSYAGVRWEVDLGLNSHGDTVVVLPTTVDAGGPGGSIRSFGQSYTLTGSGSAYNTYQLQYDPSSHSADLLVNGIVRLSNFTGETSFYFDSALAFGAWSGGEGNFNHVDVQIGSASVPEPGSLTLLAIGCGAVLFFTIRRRVSKQLT